MEAHVATTVLAENELDISIDRVEKLDAPILVIGLGGTGSEAVHVIKNTFAKRYVLPKDANGLDIPVPKNTAYLVIDSDQKSKGNLGSDEFKNISDPSLQAILENKATSPWENEWLNKNLNAISDSTGAGTYRQAARLMLSHKYPDVFSAIANKLVSISTVAHGAGGNNGRVNIVVVCGISGGTGSGTFLDIAQIVRHIMRTDAHLQNLQYRIMSYIVMPDVSSTVVPAGDPLVKIFKSNSYAALKELDFWMGYGPVHETFYTMQYTGDAGSRIKWVKPFDACALLSGSTFHGTSYSDAKKVVFNTIAENLLNYLADENVNLDANGVPEHTYISYENNLKAAVIALDKHYPANYSYRSIGTYTKKIPKKKIVYYEGRKLFDTLMPLRDEFDTIIPPKTLLTKGMCRQDAVSICGELASHYRTFSGQVLLPVFCNNDINNPTLVENMRNMRPTPHDQDNFGNTPWRSAVVTPGAVNAAEQYLSIAWNYFVDFAKNVISDPELGPFALMEYLDGDQDMSLRHAMDEMLTNWESLRRNFQGAVGNLYGDCTNSWPRFTNPPLLGRARALEEYKACLTNYFDGLRRVAFADAYVAALTKLIKRIDEYRDSSLAQLCNAMDILDKEFKEDIASSTDTSSELFALSDIKDSLDQCFEAANVNNSIGRNFLNQLSTASFVSVRNADIHGGGLRFTFASTSLSSIRLALRNQLQNSFGSVNNQSMDGILEQMVGNDPAVKQNEMGKLSNSFLSSANPLFSVDTSLLASTGKAVYTYLAIPSNSPQYFNYYKANLPDVQPKSSSMQDHLFCLTTYDGMPLYLYSQMNDLENAYCSSLTDRQKSMGVHLVWNGDLNADVTENWTKLPSPKPFYLFGANGQPSEMKKYEAALKTLDRALACGIISIDDTTPNPSYTLRIKYTEGGNGAPKTSELIKSEAEAIDAMRNPATNAPLTDPEKLAPFMQYQADADVRIITDTCNPICMQKYLGLDNKPCNPFDLALAANPVALNTARENHSKLCHALIAGYLCTDPVTWMVIDRQLEGMEYVQMRINEINGRLNAWQPRIAYAETVAKMMINKLVRINFGQAIYTLNGANGPLYDDNLTKEDIVSLRAFAKCAAYMGDLPENNPIRMQLQENLMLLERRTNDAIMNGTQTPEMISSIHDAAADLQEKLADEINEYTRLQLTVGIDQQQNSNILNMLQKMKATADSFERNYRG